MCFQDSRIRATCFLRTHRSPDDGGDLAHRMQQYFQFGAVPAASAVWSLCADDNAADFERLAAVPPPTVGNPNEKFVQKCTQLLGEFVTESSLGLRWHVAPKVRWEGA